MKLTTKGILAAIALCVLCSVDADAKPVTTTKGQQMQAFVITAGTVCTTLAFNDKVVESLCGTTAGHQYKHFLTTGYTHVEAAMAAFRVMARVMAPEVSHEDGIYGAAVATYVDTLMEIAQ